MPQIKVLISDELHALLKDASEKQDVSFARIVSQALQSSLGQGQLTVQEPILIGQGKRILAMLEDIAKRLETWPTDQPVPATQEAPVMDETRAYYHQNGSWPQEDGLPSEGQGLPDALVPPRRWRIKSLFVKE